MAKQAFYQGGCKDSDCGHLPKYHNKWLGCQVTTVSGACKCKRTFHGKRILARKRA